MSSVRKMRPVGLVGTWVRTAIIVAALVSAELHGGGVLAAEQNRMAGNIDSPLGHVPRQVASPDGRFIAFEGKANDGYHDTIWLKSVKNGARLDLLAPGDEKWPGSGATELLDWLDNDRIAFTWHCGTGCTSLEVVHIRDRSHSYVCTDGRFYLSPDRQHAVGQSDNPYMAGDARGGLALITMNDASSQSTRQGDCEATIRGSDICMPDQHQTSYAVTFKRWAPDGRSFTYTATHCAGGQLHPAEKRVFYLK